LCSLAAHADSNTLKQKVDAVVDQAITENHLVGAVVLIAQDGKTVYERAAGFADKESHKPMQLDTMFRLSSVSKPIVTVAALALVDRGQLSLDDPVTKWLPDFKPKLADGTTPTITVRQLLTHTAGLGYKFTEKPDGPYHQAQISDGLDEIRIDLAEEMRRLASVPLFSRPGSEWRYSLSIDVLGAVIESAARKPLDKAVADLVTKPLGMKDTSFLVNQAQAGRVATAYFNAPTGLARMAEPQVVALPFGTLNYSPRARLRPEGISVFGRRHDRQRAGFDEIARGDAQGRRASTQGVDRQRDVSQSNRGAERLRAGSRFRIRWRTHPGSRALKTPQSAGTLSWGGVYGHSWFVDPAKKLTVIVFTDVPPGGPAGEFHDRVRDAVYPGK
jgi:CubicO group peptidase (beta-lactamase class C family)